ncbi:MULTISPECIES: hypothetical protein [Halomicrobium]|uniref:Uncharacterized protein n=2 Tax=Halomicrobium mukohataei TaxID=57705 RepID=C7P051_HALMD|nr:MULTISPECIES: hypothetical protein [Halomicrobium]ACV48843.1 hypothetical protein Hmuk_2737 [Halomicrobium mukohataei DSM 12286]QCD64274.1 hypothetical protein E5139_00990 [Halomicrobium mukohataei]QFR19080.1 hypothetical protein GBQ70_00990 [Halomicrobium sp. ZPS1]
MRSYERPQLRPARRWYLAAYARAVKRLVGVVTVSYLLYRLGIEALYERIVYLSPPELYGHGYFAGYVHGSAQPTRLVTPFPLGEPIAVGAVPYARAVFEGPLGVGVVLSALVVLAVHAAVVVRER